MSKRLVIAVSLCFILGVVLAACAGMGTKPTASNFKAPSVKLNYVLPDYYNGFWYYGKAEVAKGKAPKGGGSSAATLAFVFDITNPNSYPVRYDSASFYVYFDDYELRVVNDGNPMWIPAGMTNTKVLTVTIDVFTTYAKFLLAGKQQALERGDDPWKKVEEWFTNLPEMSFPIDIKDGGFTFSADGIVKAVPIEARYP
ncbi:MAG: LEA type 2 family protein [Deltaproteobacteria bacterium]|jgi:hypothetical protein